MLTQKLTAGQNTQDNTNQLSAQSQMRHLYHTYPEDQRSLLKRRCKDYKSQKLGRTRGKASSRHDRITTLMISQQLWMPAKDEASQLYITE